MRIKSTRVGRRYTVIPNDATRDRRCSAEARGTLAMMMSHADEWVFSRTYIMETMCYGRDKYQRCMRELQAAGYLRLEPVRGEAGQMDGSRWFIIDEPGGADAPSGPGPDDPDLEAEAEAAALQAKIKAAETDAYEEPEREPENPSLGCDREPENRTDRGPENPTAGQPVPIRRPILKNTKRTPLPPKGGGVGDLPSADEGAAAAAVPDEDPFEAFWRVYPEAVERAAAQRAWRSVIAAGASPAEIIAAAERYAGSEVVGRGYAKKPANWLRDRNWSAEPPPAAPSADREAGADAVAALWAEKIKGGGFVPQSLGAALCRRMLDLGLVGRADLEQRGLM